MTVTRLVAAGVFFGAITLIGPDVLGQEKREIFKTPWGGEGMMLRFPGGSLTDYVKSLREASPGLNVIVAVPEANEIRIPAVQLDQVSPGSAVSLIQGQQQTVGGKLVSLYVEGFGGPPGEEASPVYKIYATPQFDKRPDTEVRVWSIGDLFETHDAQQVLSAIETAVGLLKGYPEAQIRYHADTTLVVASGEPEQMRAIDRVVAGVRHGSQKAAPRGDAGRNDNVDGLIRSLKESVGGPDSNTSLHQTRKDDLARVVELLEGLQKTIVEKDRTISELEKQLKAKKPE